MTKKIRSCGLWLLITSIAIGASAAFAAEPRESAALAAQRQRMKDRAAEVRTIAKTADPKGAVGATNLIGWWPCDEHSGLTFQDASRHNNHLRPHLAGAGGQWVRYHPDPSTLKRGDNELLFSSGGAASNGTNVELHVEYGSKNR